MAAALVARAIVGCRFDPTQAKRDEVVFIKLFQVSFVIGMQIDLVSCDSYKNRLLTRLAEGCLLTMLFGN